MKVGWSRCHQLGAGASAGSVVASGGSGVGSAPGVGSSTSSTSSTACLSVLITSIVGGRSRSGPASAKRATDGSGNASAEHRVVEQQPDRGDGGEQGVEPVHEATVARDDLAHVLDAEVALDHRLAQVAQGGHDDRDGAQGDADPPVAVEQPDHESDTGAD